MDTIGGPPLTYGQQNVGASFKTTEDRTWTKDLKPYILCNNSPLEKNSTGIEPRAS